ncbi:MAG: tocopherol cyclase family protein [bacterium]|nr:tocopherol cyclase family protein [bacterium]
MFLKKIWNPEMYQGGMRKRNYFEGWYYKVVSASEKHSWIVIPGVSFGKEKSKAHAFIQVLSAGHPLSRYFMFPISQFSCTGDRSGIRIGKNFFSRNKVILDLQEKDITIKGRLFFSKIRIPDRSLLSPGIMGWYSFVPFMECYHSLLNLQSAVAGRLAVNKKRIDFTGGRGYCEKNWGRSFPSSWIWMQSNHFKENRNTAFTASIARIPWITGPFTGFFVILMGPKKTYRMATYTGARIIKLQVSRSRLYITLKDKDYLLNIRVIRRDHSGLRAPQKGEMVRPIHESINSEIKLSLYALNDGLIFKGSGNHAGLEVMGPVSNISPYPAFTSK